MNIGLTFAGGRKHDLLPDNLYIKGCHCCVYGRSAAAKWPKQSVINVVQNKTEHWYNITDEGERVLRWAVMLLHGEVDTRQHRRKHFLILSSADREPASPSIVNIGLGNSACKFTLALDCHTIQYTRLFILSWFTDSNNQSDCWKKKILISLQPTE